MKSIRFIIAAIITAITGFGLQAQTHDHTQINAIKTETFQVSGNCDMCKTRIERAAKINGVSKAEWNVKTKVLTLEYNSSVITSDVVLRKIAAVGHDAGNFKADDKVYSSLPGCCKYR